MAFAASEPTADATVNLPICALPPDGRSGLDVSRLSRETYTSAVTDERADGCISATLRFLLLWPSASV